MIDATLAAALLLTLSPKAMSSEPVSASPLDQHQLNQQSSRDTSHVLSFSRREPRTHVRAGR